MDIIRMLETEQMKASVPEFGPGDTIRAWLKVVEGGKERPQAFEGVCLVRQRRNSLKESITIRKISHGVGVERTVLINSPRLDKIEVLRLGGRQGIFRIDLDVEVVASLLQDLQLTTYLFHNRAPDREERLDRRMRARLDLVLNGIRAPNVVPAPAALPAGS